MTDGLVLIYDLLYRLGLRADDTDFFYVAWCLRLAMAQPGRLLMPGRWLYPETAARYDTTPRQVEAGILRASRAVWRENREQLELLAGCPVEAIPAPSRFLAILAAALSPVAAA